MSSSVNSKPNKLIPLTIVRGRFYWRRVQRITLISIIKLAYHSTG
ncbi:hypothetical protein ABC502_07790 [Alkalimonas sp. NCh-2]